MTSIDAYAGQILERLRESGVLVEDGAGPSPDRVLWSVAIGLLADRAARCRHDWQPPDGTGLSACSGCGLQRRSANR